MGSNMQELMLLKQMVGSEGWLQVAFLTGMFAILVFRRESIAIPGMFKLSILFFAASLVLPSLIVPFVGVMGGGGNVFGGGYRGANSEAGFIVSLVYSGAGPLLFALSLMCGMLSLFPRKLPAPRAASVPTKHPLD
jgi:hypothetical protein